MDQRAVSIAITHALTLAITTVLVSGLLIGAGSVLEGQEKRVAESQFDEIGSDLTAQINTLDRLNETGSSVNVTVEPEYPEGVGGRSWNFKLVPGNQSNVYDTPSVIQIESPHYEQTAEYPLGNETRIEYGSPENSDSPALSLCNGEITLGECE
ncbi:DUF7266 family protein [Halovenus salina]|uniref:Uncharacterized protein n=1 Tax=Halovenus salina TaxID=1510225 RepID=A0ABD5VXJ4_9EURY|nr:hypothetical protein [Halovenus salina]